LTPAIRNEVLHRRRKGRTDRIAAVARWAAALPASLDVRAVAVFGSVARGDWRADSDIDVLVLGARLPATPVDRILALGELPDRVQPVVWTPEEYRGRRPRDLIRSEAESVGVWILGSPQRIHGQPPSATTGSRPQTAAQP
jgi:predicted nucleotidyltransferase